MKIIYFFYKIYMVVKIKLFIKSKFNKVLI